MRAALKVPLNVFRKVEYMPYSMNPPGIGRARFNAHRLFYIPALFLLFASYPGTIFLLTSRGISWFGGTTWILALIGTVILCILNLTLLLQEYPAWKKMIGAITVVALGVFFYCVLLRNDGVGTEFLLFGIRSDLVVSFLPFLTVFCLLHLINDVKRSRIVFAGQLLLIAALGFLNYKTFGSAKRFDELKVAAIFDRMNNLGFQTGSEIFNECQRIIDSEKQNECISGMQSFPAIMQSSLNP